LYESNKYIMSQTNTSTGDNQGAGTQTAGQQTTADDGQQQATGTQTGQQSSSEGTQTTTKTFTQEQVNSFLAKEKKDWEKKVADAEAKAKLSDDERLKSELETYKLQIRDRDARDSIKTEAVKLGAKNADLVYRALQNEIEFDDKGQVKNLKELFEIAKADFPELFDTKPAKPNGTADGGATNQQGLSPEELVKQDFEKTGRKNSFRL
jgi:hypothetical protein